MAEEEQKIKKASVRAGGLNSKFWRTFLVVLAAFLTFAGPTYVVYMLQSVLEISFVISVACGFVLLIVGLVLFWYLIKNKIIS